MIDWLSFGIYLDPTVPARDRPACGHTVCFDREGEILYEKPNWQPIEGSHSNKVMVKLVGGLPSPRKETGGLVAPRLLISGNPAKFFQPHNLFGSDDCRALAVDLALAACKKLDFDLSDGERSLVSGGFVALTRVDYNAMLDYGTDVEAQAVIRHLGQVGTIGRLGAGIDRQGTVYFGLGSRRWSLKAYAKGQELKAGKGHALPGSLSDRELELLTEYATGAVRLELQLRSLELNRRDLGHASMWAVETGRNELAKALEGVQMPQNVKLGGIAVEGLPLWLRPTYELWGAGVDVRTALSRATYFRHRQVLLGLGVDISRPPYGEEFNAPRPANVVPFVKTYEGKLKGIPEWALGTELLYEPKAACGGE